MKNRSLLILVPVCLLALIGAGCDCGSNLSTVVPQIDHYLVAGSPDFQPIANFSDIPDSDQITIDFGMVDINTIAKRYLLLRNEGKGNLALLKFETAAGSSTDFMVACLDKGLAVANCNPAAGDTILVDPGSDLIVEVSYIPVQVGDSSGGFTLTLNVTKHAQITVNLKGKGVTRQVQVCDSDCQGDQQDAACVQAQQKCNDQMGKDKLPVDFGDTPMSSRRARDVTIKNLGDRTLQIQSVGITGGDRDIFSVDLNGNTFPNVLPGGQQLVVKAAYAPTSGGDHSAIMSVISNDARTPSVLLQLKGRGAAPRACPNPALLDFGNVRTGDTLVKTFDVQSCGLEELVISNLKMSAGSSGDFSLVSPPAPPDLHLAAGATVTIQVQYHPMQSGSDSGGVDIYSNDVTSDPVTGLTGTVQLLGNSPLTVCSLTVTPSPINFGVVNVGDTPTIPVTFTNDGNDVCVISNTTISRNSTDSEFSLLQPPVNINLGAGQTVQTQVKYAPINLGQDTGILSIFVNDKNTSEVKVDINGFAKPAGNGPVAVCSVTPTQAVAFDTLHWKGDQSYDPNPPNTIASYQWSIVAFPAGSAATITGIGANRTTLVDLAGSYTAQLVVTNNLGQASQPCTATATCIPTQDLWIEMFWAHPDDMDLHLIAPGGQPRTNSDCYFMNCQRGDVLDWPPPGDGSTANNPHLDLDDIPGTGPENINIASPYNGVYTVMVNDYPSTVVYQDPNHVTVNVYIAGQKKATLEKDISGEDYDWCVCTVDWPSGTITQLSACAW